jgi:hypothetical protein
MGSTHRAFEATTHPRLPYFGAYAIAGNDLSESHFSHNERQASLWLNLANAPKEIMKDKAMKIGQSSI